MHKLSFFCFFLVLFLLINTAFESKGQDVSLQNIIPPSPEASGLVKNSTYPVGAFTGRPNINIPLYEIKTKSLIVPISLSYDATGIRVDDVAGWAGMNWTLNAGGAIMRMVAKIPDEDTYGFLNSPPPRISDIVDNAYYVNYFKSLNQVTTSAIDYDTDPDQFNYSFNGISGGFVFKKDKTIMQIPHKSSKITCDFMNFTFTIVDENGVTYLFKTVENTNVWTATKPSNSQIKTIKSGWYLTEMISADKAEHIYFNYYENDTSGPVRTNSFSEIFNFNSYEGTNQRHFFNWSGMERTIYAKKLKSIVFANGKVEFLRANDRLDDLGSRLDEIIVYSTKDNLNYSSIKSFKLQQGYYYSSGDYTNNATYSFGPMSQDRQRLRLDQIFLKDANSDIISKYQFFYNSTMLPPKTSCNQDWWGYANGTNGVNNKTLVPASELSGAMTGYVAIGGADRNPQETAMKAGILEKIVYPTGGYSTFDLEPHKYKRYGVHKVHVSYSASAQGRDVIGFLHEKATNFAIGNAAGTVTVSVSIAPYNTIGNAPYSNPTDQQKVGTLPYAKIKNLRTGQETVFKSSNPSYYYGYTTNNFELLGGDTYAITAWNYSNQNGALTTIGVSGDVYVDDGPFDQIVGGLRVKAIKNYSADNALSSQESYSYGQAEDGNGVLAGIDGYSTNSYIVEKKQLTPNTAGNWKSLSGGDPNIFAGTYYTVYTSGSIFDKSLLQGSPVVYPYVTKFYGDNLNNIGKIIYRYDDAHLLQNFPLPAGMSSVNNMGILTVNDYWKKGNLLWEANFKYNPDNTYRQLTKKTNTYRDTITNSSFGLLTNVINYRSPNEEESYTLGDFAYAEYPINTGFVQLTKTITEENPEDTNNTVLSVNEYTYDINHPDIVTQSINVNSKKESVRELKKYAFNKNSIAATGGLTISENAALDTMVNRNLLSPVIEKIVYKGSQQLSRTRIPYDFKSLSSQILAPSYLELQKSTFPSEKIIQYTFYDEKGNLLEQQMTDGTKVSYLWGYNYQHPVAEIKNTSYQNLITVLGQATIDQLNSNPGSDANIISLLSPLRTPGNLPNALVTTYTYKPVVGITSMTDNKGQTTTYEYDNFGRLKSIKDQNGSVVKHTNYHYQNQ
jgi:YD repeat-containing protein